MDLLDTIKTWLAEQTIDENAIYSSLGTVKVYSDEDEDRPMAFFGEDAFKIIQSEESARSFIELFEDAAAYTIEIRKTTLSSSVLLTFQDAFAYVEEA